MMLLTALAAGVVRQQMLPAAQSIARANNAFGIKLFRALPAKDENQLLSPISLTSNLRLLLVGTRGETRKTVSLVLGLRALTDKQVSAGTRDLNAGLSDETAIANSLWLAPGLKLNSGYAGLAQDSFEATVQPLRGLGITGADQINSWVSDHTKQRINQLFRTVGNDAVLVLANAVTFDGKWQSPFPHKGTRPRAFHGAAGETQVPTMSQTSMVESADSGGIQFVRLPYTGHSSLLIAMPKAGINPESVVERLNSPPSLSAANVRLFLPKFSFEDQLDLQMPLTQMGLATLFHRADFTGISSDPRLGKVSQIVQKTYVKLDEEGTEAAAATGIVVSPTAVMIEPRIQEIHIDRPFALAIRDDATGTLLFVGVVRNLK
jgi:serine protease inhibitor